MNAHPKIPARNRDLRQLVLRRRLVRIGLYLLWLALLAVGVLRFNAGHERHPMAPWQLALWLGGGAVLGFLLLRTWVLFTDRSFIATVTRSGLSHGVKGDDFRLNTAIRLVDSATGKRRRLRFEQKEGFYLLYHEGVRVCKFSALPYPLPDPRTVPTPESPPHNTTDNRSDGAFCVVCGRVNPRGSSHCEVCRHSLIRPEDLFGADSGSGKEFL